MLGYFKNLVQVSIPICGVAVIDVGQEGDDTDNDAFAFIIKCLLFDQLMNIWLDVSFVK